METQRAQKDLSLVRGCERLVGRRKGTSKRDWEVSRVGGQMQGQRTDSQKSQAGEFPGSLVVTFPLQGAQI